MPEILKQKMTTLPLRKKKEKIKVKIMAPIPVNRVITAVIVFIIMSGFSSIAFAEKGTWSSLVSDVIGYYPALGDKPDTEAPSEKLYIPKNLEFDLGLQRFLMSNTSYEIGNPDVPFQEPLSRLEFPLNTWWLDFRLRRTCPRWSAGARAGFRVATNTDGRIKDSDWENTENTQMLTTYSEGACSMEEGYLFRGDVDVNISDWLGLPKSVEIRPIFAFQFQRFILLDHDSIQ